MIRINFNDKGGASVRADAFVDGRMVPLKVSGFLPEGASDEDYVKLIGGLVFDLLTTVEQRRTEASKARGGA